MKKLAVSLISTIAFTCLCLNGCSIDREWENFIGHCSTEYGYATTPQAKLAAAKDFLWTVKNNRYAFTDHNAYIYKSSANHIDISINGIENLIEEWEKIVKLDPATPEYQMAMTRTDLNLINKQIMECWFLRNHIWYSAPLGLLWIFGLLILTIGSFIGWLMFDEC